MNVLREGKKGEITKIQSQTYRFQQKQATFLRVLESKGDQEWRKCHEKLKKIGGDPTIRRGFRRARTEEAWHDSGSLPPDSLEGDISVQWTFEFLGSAIFAMLVIVQVVMLLMVGVARLLRTFGYFKEGEERSGWRGFLRSFS